MKTSNKLELNLFVTVEGGLVFSVKCNEYSKVFIFEEFFTQSMSDNFKKLFAIPQKDNEPSTDSVIDKIMTEANISMIDFCITNPSGTITIDHPNFEGSSSDLRVALERVISRIKKMRNDLKGEQKKKPVILYHSMSTNNRNYMTAQHFNENMTLKQIRKIVEKFPGEPKSTELHWNSISTGEE